MVTLQPTERLYFEPLAPKHAQFVIQLLNTNGWIHFIGDRQVHTEADALAYIDRINNRPTTYYQVFALLETQEPIGIVTLLKRDEFDYFDIGFAMLPAYHGKGLAFEASQQQLNAIIATHQFEQLIAICTSDNVASIALLKRLGFECQSYFEEEGTAMSLFACKCTE
jgi:RimJ/RimL family protein N-acetyltransferase